MQDEGTLHGSHPDPATVPETASASPLAVGGRPLDSLATVDSLVADALRLLHGRGSGIGRTVLGLAGPPAAGKSTLAHRLVAEVNRHEGPDTAAYLPLDGFHLSNAQLDRLGLRARKGSPESFDAWGYAALLQRVATERFRDVYAPDFDRDLDEPVAARHVIRPQTRLVVTEGNYLASAEAPWQQARTVLRELWYVDEDDDLRDARLLARHLGTGDAPAVARRRIDANDHPNGEHVKAGRPLCTRVVRVPRLHPDGDRA
ncbi:nucleoside/nucleotide kinase family protein [Kitasatospora paracochleata]|uniref:Pantothenate kinase n=1 Tax=Kitasatospora paracochleata TaxID=58354 RepID=A0ABT1IZ21_9ACTN|nr:nucleoside/nucleotide kinase family protein [Kitasatospora paracochleata]MCP2310264.1 pantothenate kinase [Kitasatospora paracochleata]